jgi:hypothetical protein
MPTTAANRDSGTHDMSKELPYTCQSCTLSPSPLSWIVPSHQCELLPLSDKRESRVLSRSSLAFLLLSFSISSREGLTLFFFFYLHPSMTLSLQRLGTEL